MDRPGCDRPLRVAVVGSGPGGFYAAEALLDGPGPVEVDVYDRLPAPFGLVRYGVAPDHPKIRGITARYEKTAARDGFAFFGNVDVGRDIDLDTLRRFYDAVVLATGAQTDRRLNIPGEDLRASYTATEFVAWYNGHPDFVDRAFDLSGEVAMVIGQGNVAVDVARILCREPDELAGTDIAAHALEVLRGSRIRRVHMVGRRGPAQAAFTPPEVKELAELPACDVVVDPAALELDAASRAELERRDRRDAARNVERLREIAAREPRGRARTLCIDFFTSPREIVGGERVEGVVFERNRLVGEPGALRAEGTGERFVARCDAFFRSVGYRGVPIPGVPFDDTRAVIPSVEGRVVDGEAPAFGLYCVGWIKRGPSGVIGTNKPDAIETVRSLWTDAQAGVLPRAECPARGDVLALLRERGVRVVDWAAWKRIDAAEIERGRAAGKPREKFVRVEDMLAAAGL